MTVIIEVTREDLILAQAEIRALCTFCIDGNLFMTDECPYQRLTFANRVFKIITPTPLYKDSTFKLLFLGTSKDYSVLKILQHEGATVNLKNPSAIFAQITFNGKKYFCKQVYQNEKEFLKRHPKFRPGFHPGACSSKLAKILVNLSGVPKGSSVIDPFCGTGGICIEAAFMGMRAKGYDLEESMLEKAKINAKYYHKRISYHMKDALKLDEPCDAIVTELPFGKSTKLSISVPDLLSQFLQKAKKYTKIVVVVVPDGLEYVLPWKPLFSHTIYIHKSLSKKILVFNF